MKLLLKRKAQIWLLFLFSLPPFIQKNAICEKNFFVNQTSEVNSSFASEKLLFGLDAVYALSPEVLLLRSKLATYPLFSMMAPPVIDPAGPFCENEPSVNLTATPPGGTWSGIGIVNASTGEFDPATAGPGTHTITYTQGGESSTIDITVYDAPEITNISGDGLNCNGDADGNTIVEATGGTPFPSANPYEYDWDWDQTPENDSWPCSWGGCSGDEQNLSNLSAGIYYVTVYDVNGCTATGFAEVTQPANMMEATATDFNLDCFGDANGMIDLTVTGGFPFPATGTYQFDWDYDGIGDNNDPEDPTGLSAGNYNVTVTDFLGCTATASVNVIEPPELVVSATVTDVDCFGNSSGEIDLDVSGGTPAYLFDWDYDGTGDNDDPEDPTNLPAGTHNVTVTDANGCTATASVDVQEPLSPVDASAVGTDLSCYGEDDGSIDLTPGGGTGMYTFDWDNDGTGDNNDPEDLTGLGPGTYCVTVTDANSCTASTCVTLMEPPELTGMFDTTICQGGSIVINGTTYDENNPGGTEVFTAANGCDSTVTVTLMFDPPPQGDETYQGCEGDGYSITIGGITFNEGNPSGSVTISDPDGCDSIVNVALTFLPPTTGEENYTGCEGDGYSVVVNGTTYNEGNPNGMETLTGANGCDSVVTINLVFNPDTYFDISNNGCEGDGYSVVVNGTTYDENNPSGTETFPNANGCDSIVTINLMFGAPSDSNITYQGCQGDGYFVVVNGTTYNEGNPSGTEVTTNAAGCDSTINVNLTFLSTSTGEETYLGCEGDGYSVVVNGTTYNESNPVGQETMPGANVNGCDSIVNINLQFQPPVMTDLTYDGCEGDGYSVVVNGTTYDENNPTGTEVLTSGAGCDSIVNINLNFGQHTFFDLNYSGCIGDGYFEVVNGTVYNEGNPTGTEVFPNAAGCDSTVNINLDFQDPSTGEELYTGCQGDGYFVVVNGTVYNEGNPSGVEVLTNAAGCDSTVTINLTFNPNTTGQFVYNGCSGDGFSVVINGTVYDENNQSGTEVLQDANVWGCDSTVIVNLTFEDEINITLDPELCAGGFIIVNGTVYDEDNPSGTEVMVAQGGCDSIVHVDLTFAPPLQGFETYTGCIGDGYSVVVNGQIYDELNPTGVEEFSTPEGCDTIVDIDLDFLPGLTGVLDTTICSGGSFVLGGITFDENNPSGQATIPSSAGCDSIIDVTVSFFPIPEGWETYDGCEGDGYSVVVNGQIYDELNSNGTEEFSTPEGCDTIVHIELNFAGVTTGNVEYEGCTGDGYFVVVNGVTYDESNPNGVEFLLGQNQFGCDSIVNIDLTFNDTIITNINTQACEGQGFQIIVNGTVYDESNPTGTEVMQTPLGCDSIINVNLQFANSIYDTLALDMCPGESIVVNGTTYDENNPDGEETFTTNGGCDSIVTIDLEFHQTYSESETYTGCEGDGYEVIVNGTAYNESNPSGVEMMQSVYGCDSTVTVDLEFQPNSTGTFDYTGCEGDGFEIAIADSTFNESNPTGTVVVPNAAGCDSVIQVNLVFEDCCVPVNLEFTRSICEGDSYDFGGVPISESGTYYDTIPDAAGPGCDSIYVLTLNVADIVEDTFVEEICFGESVTFGGEEYSVEGIYADTFPGGAAQGCDSVAILDLRVHELPVIEAGDNDTITCAETSVTLNATIQGGNVIWSGPGITATNDTLVQPQVNKPGLYTLTVTSDEGCVSTDQVTVFITNDVPTADAGPDGTLDCIVDTYTLNAQVTGNNLSIAWDGPGITVQSRDELNPEVNEPGMYILIVTDTISQCISEADTAIVQDIAREIDAVISGGGTIDCDNTELLLDASQSTSGDHIVYEWQTQTGTVLGFGNQLNVSQGGMYHLMVEDTLAHCSDMDSVDIDQSDDFPGIDAGPPQQLDCNNATADLLAIPQNTGSDITYLWTGPAGGILTDPTSLNIEVSASGWYVIVAVNNSNNCMSEDSVFVSIDMEIPEAEAGQDQDLNCNETSVELDASLSSSGAGIIYVWTSPSSQVDTSVIFDADEEGWYHLLVLNQGTGCRSTDSVFIGMSDFPTDADITVEPADCDENATGSIMITQVMGGVEPFSYSLDGIIFQDDPMFEDLTPGSYTIIVSDANDCEWQTEVTIDEPAEVDIEIGSNIVLEFGDTIQLNAIISLPLSMIDSVVWSSSVPDLLSCTHCLDPILTGLESATITATVYSRGGCEDTDLIILRVDDKPTAFVPNVFSPNRDGINDYVTVFAQDNVESIKSFVIYDRWGEVVFFKENFDHSIEKLGWDGRFGTHELDPGVFVYKAIIILKGGSEDLLSGDITLVR